MPLDPAQLREQLQNGLVFSVKPDVDLAKYDALIEAIEEMRRQQERERADRDAIQRIRARERALVNINGAHQR